MKVLHYVNYPLAWAPGGHELQIHQTLRSLEKLGIKNDWIYPDTPLPEGVDILHYWTRPPNDQHVDLARQHNLKIVLSEYHQAAVLHPEWTWPLRRRLRRPLEWGMGEGLYSTLGFSIYENCDAAIAVNELEARYMQVVFGISAERCHVISNGVEDSFFQETIKPVSTDDLIYLAHITPRKNSLEVARAAKKAGVPVRFIGEPSNCPADYLEAFRSEVNSSGLRWDGGITDPAERAAVLRGARGLFLASRNEAQGIVLMEALACDCPAMGPDLAGVRLHFKESISYCPPPDAEDFIPCLQNFYQSPSIGTLDEDIVFSWDQVAGRIQNVYESVIQKG